MAITEVIYMVILLAVGFGMGWLYAKAHTMDDYNHMYSHLTCEIISRMQQAMRSMRMEQDDIDRVIDRMGCKIMPTSVLTPPPSPPEKKRDFTKYPYTLDEVVRRLSPGGVEGVGELYCSSRQPYKAWRVYEVKSDGTIVRRMFHDLRKHTIEPVVNVYDNIQELAKDFISYDYRFLSDFDRSEWQ